MRNYSHFAMPCAKMVNHGLESLSYIGSKLWDSIPSHMKEIDFINEFKHVIKTSKLICAHAYFEKFIYKILNICSQQKNPKTHTYMYTKIRIS